MITLRPRDQHVWDRGRDQDQLLWDRDRDRDQKSDLETLTSLLISQFELVFENVFFGCNFSRYLIIHQVSYAISDTPLISLSIVAKTLSLAIIVYNYMLLLQLEYNLCRRRN